MTTTLKHYIADTLREGMAPDLAALPDENLLHAAQVSTALLDMVDGAWQEVEHYDPCCPDVAGFELLLYNADGNVRLHNERLVVVGNDGMHTIYWLFTRTLN